MSLSSLVISQKQLNITYMLDNFVSNKYKITFIGHCITNNTHFNNLVTPPS